MIKSKRFKSLIATILTIAMIGVFTGCNNNNSGSSKKDSLVVATAYDAKSLDPYAVNDVASANVMMQIYQTLIKEGDDGKLEPLLAESFEQVDETIFKFKLKKGVKFHNGEEMKASDVKFSFTKAAQSAPIAHIMGDIDIDSFVIDDDYTISFKIKNPSSAFLAGLVHSGAAILSEKAYTEAGENYGMSPIGTGPFKFVSWAKGDNVVLERFDDFYGEKPALKNITIKVIPEPTNRTIELESGGVDIAYEISANDLKRIEENENLKLVRGFDYSVQYLGINTQKAPFNNEKVRQAITHAIDVESVVESAYRGIGKVAKGPMSPTIKYYNDGLQPLEYNVEKAKKLLAEAGYPDGFKAEIWTNEKKERVDMATIIQEQLKQVGIEIDVKVFEWGAYLSGLDNAQHDMYFLGWTAETTDPHTALYALYHSSAKGAGGNRSFFEDSKVDELLSKGATMLDSPEREAAYKEVQKILVEKAPAVFMENGEQVVGTTKQVTGFKTSPVGYHVLYNVKFE
ncbi:MULTISPECIES: ABC transporter substrate-binding protein [unclassified Clostridium]|uniref:ABC transporter substrate-binding protein n=1 Tax=unclassified Clostridium TaxID=2614128 RepID=UPI0025BBDA85|nr:MULTISPECIES: ABC transporter substrate-binding protein [unclassified Clostridium]